MLLGKRDKHSLSTLSAVKKKLNPMCGVATTEESKLAQGPRIYCSISDFLEFAKKPSATWPKERS